LLIQIIIIIYYEDTFPKIEKVRGKIIILTRETYKCTNHNYINVKFGKQVLIPEMGDYYEYSNTGGENYGIKCYPVISNTNHRVQDFYNLEKDNKWDIVYDVLTNNVKCRNSTDSVSYRIYDDRIVEKFYTEGYTNVLTINFMSMARASDENNPFKWSSLNSYFFGFIDTISDSSIETSAIYMNDKLANFFIKKIYIINRL